MMKIKLNRLSNEDPTRVRAHRAAGSIGVAILLLMTGIACAQGAAAANSASVPQAPQPTVQDGFVLHQSADLGGHYANINGSGSMYDTLVNIHSGPRVLGQTFTLHAVPGSKHALLDDLSAFTNGFGGDPINVVKLDFSKGKLYEFSGIFRRDRQYFDYNLLGNPNIPGGYSIPVSGSTTPLAWPQVTDSPFMFNTVRRMTDTYLTLFPLSKVTFRIGYSQNIFQGPSMTPSGNSIAGQELILEEYQRNSTDDFTGAIDWKPVNGTKFTFEEQVDHYKGDSYFNVAPQYYRVQEADGTPVALLSSYTAYLPYGYNATGHYVPYAPSTATGAAASSGVCSSAIASSSKILYNNPTGGLPIIDPACYVVTSYLRSQPTREIFPSEIFRMQTSSIKNISMNGDLRYTNANMNLPNYFETFNGLTTTTRSTTYVGNATAKREVIAADYGITWQATEKVSVSDQVNFSNVHQPGTSNFTSGTTVKIASGPDTINNTALTSSTVTTGAAPFEGSAGIGAPLPGYFGQKFVINNASVSWDATSRATFALTYRYASHDIIQGAATGTASSVVSITENGGIFNAALRPSTNWDINGSVEILYDNNVLTPVAPRQTQHYRVHTLYRPRTWATLSAAFNDVEHHNNTNNTGVPSAVGPLQHEDHSRVVSLGADLMPNQHYGLDLNYAYTDVYTSTNACAQSTTSALPAGGVLPGIATPTGSLCAPASGGTRPAVLAGPFKDFEDAPTQFGSVAVALIPVPKLHADLGYRATSTNGTRAFTDTGDVNGSLVSTYQTPFVNLAWTLHPGLIWKGEYDYYGYGEGHAPSGSEYCNTNTAVLTGATSVTPVPCSTVANTAMSGPSYGFTSPRNFHSNVLTVSIHYEF
jgi:hypothetical protein